MFPLPMFLLLLLLQVHSAYCNTEKVIFLAPTPIQIPTTHPTLEDLHLHALTSKETSQRTHVKAAFPTETLPGGPSTWLLLSNLSPKRRYEVRICWAATQPTSFDLSVYELETVFSSPELITSLAEFSATQQPSLQETALEQARKPIAKEIEQSLLLLRILAKADYYTMNQTLMENVPPVYVDIILDPYLMNVFPKSLMPTAIYIVVLAVGAWILGKWVSTWLLDVQKQDEVGKTKKES